MKYVREWQGLGPRIEVSSFHCLIDVALLLIRKSLVALPLALFVLLQNFK